MNAMQIMPRPLTRREFAETEREMREAVAPVIREMVHLHCFARPTYLLHGDGRFERQDDGLTEPMRDRMKSLKALQEFIAAPYLAKMKHGFRD